MEMFIVIVGIAGLIWYYGRSSESEQDKATREAQYTISSSKLQADNIIGNAKKQADHIINNAKKDAGNIVNVAQKEAASTTKTTQSKKDFIDNFLKSKIRDFPVVATVIADYETACDKKVESTLRNKSHSAPKAADEVKKIRQSNKLLIAENKALKWELKYIRDLLPWIDELEDNPIEPQPPAYYNTTNVNDDEVSYWLSPSEYAQLSITEKNQKALDRYKKRNKTNSEIGREYERYIGYLYEQDGYDVNYFGIEKNKEDLGRDLICKRNKEILIVQCKCWSNKQKKIIHEKYINQLLGTTLEYYYENISQNLSSFFNQNNCQLIPVFVSTVPLSDKAKQFADVLKVQFRQIILEDYPMIKCNIYNGPKNLDQYFIF